VRGGDLANKTYEAEFREERPAISTVQPYCVRCLHDCSWYAILGDISQNIIFLADVKKMPLGKLSKPQIAKGYECLEELEAVLKQPKPSRPKSTELSSRFYTLVPHNFGRRRPPVIEEMDVIQSKYDMLAVRMQNTISF
jgi:hypothetical protein